MTLDDRGGTAPTFSTIEEFRQWLVERGHPVDRLGGVVPGTKTLEEWWEELRAGESTIEDDPLRRKVSVATGTIRPHENSHRMLLELEQRFSDDRPPRRRNQELGEKLKPGEEPLAALSRGITEELQVAQEHVDIDGDSHEARSCEDFSRSFQITTRYDIHHFDAVVTGLPDVPFERADAAEKEVLPAKTHVFGWATA